MKKSEAKAILEEEIKREHTYLKKQAVGSEEYNNSQKRLSDLATKLGELEELEVSWLDRAGKFGLEVAKTVSGVVVPVGCLIMVTAQERSITFTGAARMLIQSIVPGGRKMF